MGRKIPFDNVIRNLRRSTYTKLVDDYARGGHELFDENKFADNLGVSKDWLKQEGIKIEENYGWKLITKPSVQDILDARGIIEARANYEEEHNKYFLLKRQQQKVSV